MIFIFLHYIIWVVAYNKLLIFVACELVVSPFWTLFPSSLHLELDCNQSPPFIESVVIMIEFQKLKYSLEKLKKRRICGMYTFSIQWYTRENAEIQLKNAYTHTGWKSETPVSKNPKQVVYRLYITVYIHCIQQYFEQKRRGWSPNTTTAGNTFNIY